MRSQHRDGSSWKSPTRAEGLINRVESACYWMLQRDSIGTSIVSRCSFHWMSSSFRQAQGGLSVLLHPERSPPQKTSLQVDVHSCRVILCPPDMQDGASRGTSSEWWGFEAAQPTLHLFGLFHHPAIMYVSNVKHVVFERRRMIFYRLCLLILSITALAVTTGCGTPAPSQSPQYPVEVVSVQETNPYKPGQTITPGGPTIEIRLKNVSRESIISLNVTLVIMDDRTFEYDFDVSPETPLSPNRIISSVRRDIGGGWGGSTPYSLDISGAMQSGEAFAFNWKPPGH
jgi:hypothetical protein